MSLFAWRNDILSFDEIQQWDEAEIFRKIKIAGKLERMVKEKEMKIIWRIRLYQLLLWSDKGIYLHPSRHEYKKWDPIGRHWTRDYKGAIQYMDDLWNEYIK